MRVLLPLTLLFAAVPAVAGAAPLMKAAPQAAVEGRILTKGAAWTCVDGTCRTVSDASRPSILCERLVKEVGTLASFVVDDKPMDEAELAKCNAKTR